MSGMGLESNATPDTGTSPSLSGVATLIGVVTASAYVLGFVIVNTYLTQFGVRDIDAFSMQYLAAGAAFLALAAITYFAAYRDLFDLPSAAKARTASLVHRAIPAAQAERLAAPATAVAPLFALVLIHAFVIASMVGRVTAASVVVFAFLVVSYLSALPWLVSRKEVPLWERWTVLIGHLGVGIGYVVYVTGFGQFDERMLLLVLLLPTSSLLIGWWWLPKADRTSAIRVWAVTTLFFSSGVYGLVIYGHVPLTYGGGRPETVRLVMKETNPSLGMLLQMQDGISAPLELVAQTGAEFVVVAPLSGKRSVIRISRGEVLALLRQM